MEGRPPEYPVWLYLAVIAVAIGTTLVAVGVTGHSGWALVGPGFLLIVVALPIIWMLEADKIRAASKSKRGRHRLRP